MVKEEFNSVSDPSGSTARNAVEQRILHDEIDPTSTSLAGSAVLSQAKATREERKEKEEEKNGHFLLQAERVRRYLERLDYVIQTTRARVAELKAQHEEASRLAIEAFDRVHEAEDLLQDLVYGISDEEQDRLIQLLGPVAINATPDEIEALLKERIEEEKAEGRKQTELADELNVVIREEEARLYELEQIRENYATVSNPEEQLRLEEQIDTYLSVKTIEHHAEEFMAPDFAGLGLPLK